MRCPHCKKGLPEDFDPAHLARKWADRDTERLRGEVKHLMKLLAAICLDNDGVVVISKEAEQKVSTKGRIRQHHQMVSGSLVLEYVE